MTYAPSRRPDTQTFTFQSTLSPSTEHVCDVDDGPQVSPVADQLEVLHQGGEDNSPVVQEVVILAVFGPAGDVGAVVRQQGAAAPRLAVWHVISVPGRQSPPLTTTGVLLTRGNWTSGTKFYILKFLFFVSPF